MSVGKEALTPNPSSEGEGSGTEHSSRPEPILAEIRPPARAPARPEVRRAHEGFIIGLALTAALAGVQFITYTGRYVPFVPYSMAESLRDLLPSGIKTAGIESLGYGAKTLLIAGSIALFILLGGLLGAVYAAVRPRLPKNDLLRGLLVGGVAFLLMLPLEVARNWIPADLLIGPIGLLLLSLLWGLALDQSIRGAAIRPDLPPNMDSGLMSRRTFLLQTAAGGVLIGVFGTAIAKLLEGGPLFTFNLPAPAPSPTPDAQGFVPARGTWREVTPNDQFYQVDIGVGNPPELSTAGWRLSIGGLVDNPSSYSLDDLLQKFKTEPPFYGTLVCISNEIGGELTGTALWEGVRLADVLNAAGIKPNAVDVVFKCADGYSDSLPIAAALHPDTYLVYRMNGQPLPIKHGYPMRVYIPTRYGEKNPKWITSITVVDVDYKGYWQQEGWSDEALIKHSATINTLDRLNHVSMINDKTAEVGGIANGGGREISKVEFKIDDSLWQTATLKKPLSPFMWVLWKAQFPTTPGNRVKLTVRAFDGQGNPQIEPHAPPHPDGASGYDSRDVFPMIDQPPTSTPTATSPAKPTVQSTASATSSK